MTQTELPIVIWQSKNKKRKCSFDFRKEQKIDVIFLKLYYNKCVKLLFSYKECDAVDFAKKRWSLSNKAYIQAPRLDIISEYNSIIGGVDLHDMLVALYKTKVGVNKYYIRILYQLLDVCIVNTWLIYFRECSNLNIIKHTALHDFRSELAESLIKSNKPATDEKQERL